MVAICWDRRATVSRIAREIKSPSPEAPPREEGAKEMLEKGKSVWVTEGRRNKEITQLNTFHRDQKYLLSPRGSDDK